MDLTILKKELSSLQEVIYFDPNHYLRKKTSNPSMLKKVINSAVIVLEQLKVDSLFDVDETYFFYGALGKLYRIYGEPKTAAHYLTLNLNHSIEAGNHSREIVSLVHLGEALKYDNKLEDALEKFNLALVRCEEIQQNAYLDFA